MDALASPRGPDPSSLIASKLLEGWALLADSCPVCLTPLVRNRQKQQLLCVSCDKLLLTEDQLAHQLQAQHVHDSPPTSPAIAQTTATASHRRVASQRDDATTSSDERSPKRQANASVLVSGGLSFNVSEDTNMSAPLAGPSLLYPVKFPKVVSASLAVGVISCTTSTLFHKIEEIRRAIEVCQDTRDLQQLLRAMGECTHAIERVRSLRNG